MVGATCWKNILVTRGRTILFSLSCVYQTFQQNLHVMLIDISNYKYKQIQFLTDIIRLAKLNNIKKEVVWGSAEVSGTLPYTMVCNSAKYNFTLFSTLVLNKFIYSSYLSALRLVTR